MSHLSEVIRDTLRAVLGANSPVVVPPSSHSYLKATVEAILGASPTPPIPDDSAKSERSALASSLCDAFPGREAFCERLAAIAEMSKRIWAEPRGEASRDGYRPKHPNVLVLGGKGVGKTYLLSQVLPAVVPSLQQAHGRETDLRPFAAYVDARHLGRPSVDHSFGPIFMAQMLMACSNVPPDVWMSDLPAVICIDHLESVWASEVSEHRLTHSAASRGAALAAVLRGVQVPVPEAQHSAFGRGAPTRLDTGNVLFVAVVDLPQLRAVLDKRIGLMGTVAITGEHLVEAGMPASLVAEFPVMLSLPPIARASFRSMLRQQTERPTHAGFVQLRRLAAALGLDLSFDEDAVDQLLAFTFEGVPRFHHLEQLLAGIGEIIQAHVPRTRAVLIRGADVTSLQERAKVLPGEASQAP